MKDEFIKMMPALPEVLLPILYCTCLEFVLYPVSQCHKYFPKNLSLGWLWPVQVSTDGPSVIDLLVEMPTGDPWDDAELWTIYEYARGSKRLKLPEAYRAVLFQTSS